VCLFSPSIPFRQACFPCGEKEVCKIGRLEYINSMSESWRRNGENIAEQERYTDT